jgi:Trk K+ transport system NAD-binding subunit
VVSLYSTGAMKAASLLLNPNVDQFFETVSAGNNAINLTEIRVTDGSSYAGKALNRTDFGQRGVVIVGLRRGADELLLPVPGTEVIRMGDSLIALGKAEAIAALVI